MDVKKITLVKTASMPDATTKVCKIVKEIRNRTDKAWIYIPNGLNLENGSCLYASPCNELNIIHILYIDGKAITFNINTLPEEVHYFIFE